jgi:hypothetical protein
MHRETRKKRRRNKKRTKLTEERSLEDRELRTQNQEEGK